MKLLNIVAYVMELVRHPGINVVNKATVPRITSIYAKLRTSPSPSTFDTQRPQIFS
jgi:hypothetical protein